ncbi:MAG: 1-acyl-sn-glycerol-3-phosphate acyltransferase, partial [Synechococcus sp.]|nr:1-acyl-sn-glycerol-3-phosphate acyltransferase [Synechococcus sp.]
MSDITPRPTPRPSLTYRLVSALLVFPLFRGLFRG